MERILLMIVLALLASGVSAVQAEKLYKWVDSQGRVTYRDQPPPEGAGFRVEEKMFGERGTARETGDETLAKIVEKYPVTLYSVPVCGSCDLARIYLQKRKVPFNEKNLENDPELQQTLKKKVGALSAPTIMIGEKVMKGYVESILEGELDSAGYPKSEAPESSTGANQEKGNPPAAVESGYRPARRRY
jgi:glutaredoxin